MALAGMGNAGARLGKRVAEARAERGTGTVVTARLKTQMLMEMVADRVAAKLLAHLRLVALGIRSRGRCRLRIRPILTDCIHRFDQTSFARRTLQ